MRAESSTDRSREVSREPGQPSFPLGSSAKSNGRRPKEERERPSLLGRKHLAAHLCQDRQQPSSSGENIREPLGSDSASTPQLNFCSPMAPMTKCPSTHLFSHTSKQAASSDSGSIWKTEYAHILSVHTASLSMTARLPLRSSHVSNYCFDVGCSFVIPLLTLLMVQVTVNMLEHFTFIFLMQCQMFKAEF